MSKLAIILFYTIWNNIGNLGYFVYQCWFHFEHIGENMSLETYIKAQAYNHIIVLLFAMLLFYIREYRKSI
jgi:hypothetical protein